MCVVQKAIARRTCWMAIVFAMVVPLLQMISVIHARQNLMPSSQVDPKTTWSWSKLSSSVFGDIYCVTAFDSRLDQSVRLGSTPVLIGPAVATLRQKQMPKWLAEYIDSRRSQPFFSTVERITIVRVGWPVKWAAWHRGTSVSGLSYAVAPQNSIELSIGQLFSLMALSFVVFMVMATVFHVLVRQVRTYRHECVVCAYPICASVCPECGHTHSEQLASKDLKMNVYPEEE